MGKEYIQGLVSQLQLQYQTFEKEESTWAVPPKLAAVRGMVDICKSIYISRETVSISSISKSLFIRAAEYGCHDTVCFFMEWEKTVKLQPEILSTALRKAIQQGHRNVVELLVQALKKPYMHTAEVDQYLEKTLMFAIECGRLEFVRLLAPQVKPEGVKQAYHLLEEQQAQKAQLSAYLQTCLAQAEPDLVQRSPQVSLLTFSNKGLRKDSEQVSRATSPSFSETIATGGYVSDSGSTTNTAT